MLYVYSYRESDVFATLFVDVLVHSSPISWPVPLFYGFNKVFVSECLDLNARFISRVTDQNGASRIFDLFTFLHENVQQCVHFDVMTLILVSDH